MHYAFIITGFVFSLLIVAGVCLERGKKVGYAIGKEEGFHAGWRVGNAAPRRDTWS